MKKICLITGGSRGLGKNLVNKLLKKNFKVFFTYNKTSKPILENKNLLGLKMNLEDDLQIKKIFYKIKKKFNFYPNILINNAAISQEKKFEKLTKNDLKKMFNINIIGQIRITQHFLNFYFKQKNEFGRIVNISSIGGQWGGRNQIHYAAAKAGLINFSKSISNLYSDKKITCNSIAIGLMATDMSKKEINSKKGLNKIKNIPIGRIANLDEVSFAIEFLISKEASYVTGQCINLNGGMLML